MATTNFVHGETLTDDDWFNDLDNFYYTIFGDPTITNQVFDIATNGDVSILDTSGGTPFFFDVSANQLQVGKGLTTAQASIELGTGRTDNGYSSIDFISDTTYPDYAFRILRHNSGANANSQIYHRGTGNLIIQAQDAGAIVLNTNSINAITVDSSQDIVIGTVSAAGQLHVDQPSATGAQPVLYLDQADVSEEMIEFNTTIGTGNAIEAVGAKTLTTTHFIKVTLPGSLTRYIPVGTIA